MTKVRLLLLACLGCAILSFGEFNTRGLRAEEPVPVPVPCPNQGYESILCPDAAPMCVQDVVCADYKGSIRASGTFDSAKTLVKSGAMLDGNTTTQMLCYTAYTCAGVKGKGCQPDQALVGQPTGRLGYPGMMCGVITPPVPTVP
jgi:hypothetical protein